MKTPGKPSLWPSAKRVLEASAALQASRPNRTATPKPKRTATPRPSPKAADSERKGTDSETLLHSDSEAEPEGNSGSKSKILESDGTPMHGKLLAKEDSGDSVFVSAMDSHEIAIKKVKSQKSPKAVDELEDPESEIKFFGGKQAESHGTLSAESKVSGVDCDSVTGGSPDGDYPDPSPHPESQPASQHHTCHSVLVRIATLLQPGALLFERLNSHEILIRFCSEAARDDLSKLLAELDDVKHDVNSVGLVDTVSKRKFGKVPKNPLRIDLSLRASSLEDVFMRVAERADAY